MNEQIADFSKLGISPEVITPDFPASIHGRLGTTILRRIDDEQNKPKIIWAGQPEESNEVDPNQFMQKLVLGAHEKLASLYNIFCNDQIPYIFRDQEHYNIFGNNGLMALTEDQARTALTVLDTEDEAKETHRKLFVEAQKRTEVAVEEKDLATYLMWQLKIAEENSDAIRRESWAVDSAIYRAAIGSSPQTLEERIAEIDSAKSKFLTEARLVRRMHQMISGMPDEDKIRMAILRLPAEADRDRRPRVLTAFPERSYSGWANKVERTNLEPQLMYTITDSACILHSFDTMYKLTRRETRNGQFEPRPFYLTAQEAQTDGVNVPSEIRRFLEVSFTDGTPPFPDIRAQFPQIEFRQARAILGQDFDKKLISEDGQLHFIIGKDEYGENITQDLIPYTIDNLVGRVSNAYNLRVDQFFRD
jgi:hypothetical protein